MKISKLVEDVTAGLADRTFKIEDNTIRFELWTVDGTEAASTGEGVKLTFEVKVRAKNPSPLQISDEVLQQSSTRENRWKNRR